MEKNNEVIQTHPLVGWDISTVDSYDALMLRLHYQTPNKSVIDCCQSKFFILFLLCLKSNILV